MFAVYVRLSEYNGVMSMDSPVCDPILLRKDGRGIDDKLVGLGIVRGSSFHLNCIVSVSQFGQGETADQGEIIDLGQVLSVALGAEGDHSAAK